MIERLQASAIDEEGEKRQETAQELVQREDGCGPFRREAIPAMLAFAPPDKAQLSPEPAYGQEKNDRADQPRDVVSHSVLIKRRVSSVHPFSPLLSDFSPETPQAG